MAPEDLTVMNELSKLYKENDRYDDQIFVLEKILSVDEGNEIAQSELAMHSKTVVRILWMFIGNATKTIQVT